MTSVADPSAVVAGVDGSTSSLVALRWAAADASRRGAALRVIIARAPALDWPHDTAEHVGRLESALTERTAAIEASARATLGAAGEAATRIEIGAVIGNAASLLLQASATAAEIVIGSRGLGGLRGALAGSVAGQLAGNTACPLVVIRDLPDEPAGVVVVGIDGPASLPAVRYAAAHAERVQARLRAVACWAGTPLGGSDPDAAPDVDREAAYRGEMDQLLGPVRRDFPRVHLDAVVRYGRTAAVLADEAASADLLVVGARGRGGFASLVLGSTALTVLHEVASPVAVVPLAPL